MRAPAPRIPNGSSLLSPESPPSPISRVGIGSAANRFSHEPTLGPEEFLGENVITSPLRRQQLPHILLNRCPQAVAVALVLEDIMKFEPVRLVLCLRREV